MHLLFLGTLAVFLVLLFAGVIISALTEFTGLTVVVLFLLGYWLGKDFTHSRRP